MRCRCHVVIPTHKQFSSDCRSTPGASDFSVIHKMGKCIFCEFVCLYLRVISPMWMYWWSTYDIHIKWIYFICISPLRHRPSIQWTERVNQWSSMSPAFIRFDYFAFQCGRFFVLFCCLCLVIASYCELTVQIVLELNKTFRSVKSALLSAVHRANDSASRKCVKSNRIRDVIRECGRCDDYKTSAIERHEVEVRTKRTKKSTAT